MLTHLCIPSLNPVIVFALAVKVLLSVAFSIRLFCDLSLHELYCQSSEYVTVKPIIYDSLFIIYGLLY